MKMTNEQIQALEKEAEQNSGHCSNCNQTIKIYRYKINRVHASFLRAMGAKVHEVGKNDVDISDIGLSYSVRSQVTKMRQHGLIARVKNKDGTQVARHWLITKKGWDFLGGSQITETVVVYNNQVLGHDGKLVTMAQLLGEPYQPISYDEIAVGEPESRTYHDIREPKRELEIRATYRGYPFSIYEQGQEYTLKLEKLQVGSPVIVISPARFTYNDIASFQKDWEIIK